jgi:hypothetical protein
MRRCTTISLQRLARPHADRRDLPRAAGHGGQSGFPAQTVSEFISHAKANPGKINFGSGGNGSVAHVTGELFKMMTGTDMQHVPYRGSPQALTDLIGGQVHVMFDNLPSSIEHIRAGRLRALGWARQAGWKAFRTCRPLANLSAASRPAPSRASARRRHAGRNRREAQPRGERRPRRREPSRPASPRSAGFRCGFSSAEFGKFFADETEKWSKAVKFSGARAS